MIVALNPFEFIYLPDGKRGRSDLATITVDAGQMIAFTSDCFHAGGANKLRQTVYRLFAYMVSNEDDFPGDNVRTTWWTSEEANATLSLEDPDASEDSNDSPNDEVRPTLWTSKGTNATLEDPDALEEPKTSKRRRKI